MREQLVRSPLAAGNSSERLSSAGAVVTAGGAVFQLPAADVGAAPPAVLLHVIKYKCTKVYIFSQQNLSNFVVCMIKNG